MSTNSQLKFGIVGYGSIGKRHASIITKLGILKCICDPGLHNTPNPGKVALPTYYKDFNVMLNEEADLDIIVICTPNGFHALQTILALQHGKHVICEKPMALNGIDCQNMINTAVEYGKNLFVVKQNRFNPLMILLKQLWEEGYLGEIFSIQMNCFWNRDKSYFDNPWRGKQHLDGGILFTQFSHFFDLIIWLVGFPDSVKGFAKNFNHKKVVDLEDTGAVIMDFNNGPIAGVHYSINSFEKNLEGSIIILGSKGSIKIGGEYLNKLEYLLLEDMAKQEEVLANDIYKTSKQDKLYNHYQFYKYVLNELSSPLINLGSLKDAMNTVKLIEKINSSFLLT